MGFYGVHGLLEVGMWPLSLMIFCLPGKHGWLKCMGRLKGCRKAVKRLWFGHERADRTSKGVTSLRL